MSDSWNQAGAFVSALAECDFDTMGGLVAPEARLRAVLPSRVMDVSGRGAVRDAFDTWFGDGELTLEDATIGVVGAKTYLRWRLRVIQEQRYVVEQHLFVVPGDQGLASLDLVCSGFQAVAS